MKHDDPLYDSTMFKHAVNRLPQNQSLANSQWTEQEARRQRLYTQLAALCKLFQNERTALEDMLTEQGILDMSGSLYALDWYKLWKAAEETRAAWRSRGYWKRLWDALRDRNPPPLP